MRNPGTRASPSIQPKSHMGVVGWDFRGMAGFSDRRRRREWDGRGVIRRSPLNWYRRRVAAGRTAEHNTKDVPCKY